MSLSLRLTGCCPSCEEEDDEVVLKSSGAAAPLPFTSPYGTTPSDAGTPPVAMAAPPGGVSAGRPLAVLPFSEEESSERQTQKEMFERVLIKSDTCGCGV